MRAFAFTRSGLRLLSPALVARQTTQPTSPTQPSCKVVFPHPLTHTDLITRPQQQVQSEPSMFARSCTWFNFCWCACVDGTSAVKQDALLSLNGGIATLAQKSWQQPRLVQRESLSCPQLAWYVMKSLFALCYLSKKLVPFLCLTSRT